MLMSASALTVSICYFDLNKWLDEENLAPTDAQLERKSDFNYLSRQL